MHGFDPEKIADMGATFMAWGPSIKKGMSIEPFQNVEVYDLISKILGLQTNVNDGKEILSKQVLN